jgi:trehalose-phosphatase
MINIFLELDTIIENNTARSIVLFLDFDGTLSPIVKRADQAMISTDIKTTLSELSKNKKNHIVVVSGRTLSDVKQRVGINNISYAGNHGLEWSIDGKDGAVPIKDTFHTQLNNLHVTLKKSIEKFPNTYIQDKGLSLSVHYRLLPPDREEEFHAMFSKIAQSLDPKLFSVIQGKKVYDILPAEGGTKGTFCTYFLSQIKPSIPPTQVWYVGDDTTDEDAFKMLPDAITVRVGNDSRSLARYYVDSQKEVAMLLKKLC